MSAKKGVAFLLVASLGLISFSVVAATNSADRVEKWSQLPDWTGLWEMNMGGGPPGGGAGPEAGESAGPVVPGPRESWSLTPQKKADYQALQAELARMEGTEQMPDTTVTECTWGFPRVLSGPYMFEVTVTPELTFFNYDIREFRHIWTDGRDHPKKVTASSSGHSVGRWEGDTLVVDTVGVQAGLWITGQGMTLSDQASFKERWRVADDGLLHAEVTITDPLSFTKPYVLSRSFKRVTDFNRMIQQNCFENVHEVQVGDKVMTKFSIPATD